MTIIIEHERVDLRIDLPVFTLCDAASIRGGMLNILGAGITALNRKSFPARVDADIALTLAMSGDFSDDGVELSLTIENSAGAEIAEPYSATIGSDEPWNTAYGAPGIYPIIVSLRDVDVPDVDVYKAVFRANGQILGTLKYQSFLRESSRSD